MKSHNPSHHQPEDDSRTSNTGLKLNPEMKYNHVLFASVWDSSKMERPKTLPIFKEQNPDEEAHHHTELRRLTTTFVNNVLSKEWSESSNVIFAEAVALHGRTFTRSGISSILCFFQACHVKLQLEDFTIHNIHVDLENHKAAVRGDMVYCGTHPGMERELTEGPCILHFELTSVGWHIAQMEIPGL